MTTKFCKYFVSAKVLRTYFFIPMILKNLFCVEFLFFFNLSQSYSDANFAKNPPTHQGQQNSFYFWRQNLRYYWPLWSKHLRYASPVDHGTEITCRNKPSHPRTIIHHSHEQGNKNEWIAGMPDDSHPNSISARCKHGFERERGSFLLLLLLQVAMAKVAMACAILLHLILLLHD